MTRTTTFYVPTAGQPRWDENELRERGDALVRVECPRLLAKKNASGAADVAIDVAGDGTVSRAAVEKSSGDPRLDDIFGALVAQLQLPVDTAAHGQATKRKATVGFACSPTVSTITLEIAPPARS